MKGDIGTLAITPHGVTIQFSNHPHAHACHVDGPPTIDLVTEAADILAAWLELSYQDTTKEAERVAAREETSKALREKWDAERAMREE
jgi:hypothetical protein